MKLIHTADLHLDSSLTTNFDSAKSAILKKELLQSFIRLVDWARDNGVSVIMISGDMFDSPASDNALIKMQVESVIAQNPLIDFLYLRGNHDLNEMNGDDYFTKVAAKLPNLKLFSTKKWTYYKYSIGEGSDHKTIVISGREVSNAEQLQHKGSAEKLFDDGGDSGDDFYDSLNLNVNDINIVMLHGDVLSKSTRRGEIAFDLNILSKKNISYLALGHIHQYKKEKLGDKGVWCYSGCLTGRGFDECVPLGEGSTRKGFVTLDVDSAARSIKMKFIPFARRNIFDIDVTLKGSMSYSSIFSAIISATGDVTSDDIIRINLIGSVSEETKPNISALEEQLEERFFYLTIIDKTSLAIDQKEYENEVSLKSVFIKKVLSAPDLTSDQKRDIIRVALEALGL